MRHRVSRAVIVGVIAIVVIAGLVGVVGYTVYRQSFDAIRAQRYSELRVIGALKVDQIVDWRNDRLADDRVGAAWVFTGSVVADWLAHPASSALRAGVLERLDLLAQRDPAHPAEPAQYADVILAAADGRLLLSSDPGTTDLDAEARRLAAAVIASPLPAMGDFVREDPSGRVHVDVAAPILDPSGRPLAVLILRSDPGPRLYPVIESWPTPSQSAETLLVRREGDSVLFLNVLRHTDDAAMTIREPLTNLDVPAVAAALGRVGEFEGVDYRGVGVLADLRAVPGSPWFMVAKVDSAEILAEVGDRGRTILLFGLLVVLLTGGAVALALSLRHGSLQRRLVSSERARAAVSLRYERALALARDIFLLMDRSGRIVDANAAAVAAYGYSREELLALHVTDLRTPEARATLDRDWQAAASPDGALFETVHVRHDGSSFPVEVSSRGIDVDGVRHKESFVRDISSRRAAEAELRRSNAAYATLAATNQAIVRVRAAAALFGSICRVAAEFGGYPGAWVGVADEASRRIVPVAIAGTIDDYIRQLEISTDPAEPKGRGPTALALRHGSPYYCDDLLADPATAPWHDLAARFGVRSSVALPLLRGGAPAAVLSLYGGEPHIFDAQMRALLEEMAADISFALDGFDRDAARVRADEALAASQADLAAQLDELRRWNESMLGREDRALELKGEVNDLLARLGETPRYPSATGDGAPDGAAPDAGAPDAPDRPVPHG